MMTFADFQERLIDLVFGPNTSPEDILERAERANLTPQVYICEALRVAIEQAGRNAGAEIFENQYAMRAICDFVGVVDG